jgi:hypothetical protein
MSHLETLCARRVTCSKFSAEGPKMLGAIVQNFVAGETWEL